MVLIAKPNRSTIRYPSVQVIATNKTTYPHCDTATSVHHVCLHYALYYEILPQATRFEVDNYLLIAVLEFCAAQTLATILRAIMEPPWQQMSST